MASTMDPSSVESYVSTRERKRERREEEGRNSQGQQRERMSSPRARNLPPPTLSVYPLVYSGEEGREDSHSQQSSMYAATRPCPKGSKEALGVSAEE